MWYWRRAEPGRAFFRIVAFDEVPIARGLFVGGEPQQRFERNVAIESAVIEVCRPQSRHSNKRGRLFNAAKRLAPQAGQTKPSGQRRSNMKAAQLASSEKAC